jgi:hypothetical protein
MFLAGKPLEQWTMRQLFDDFGLDDNTRVCDRYFLDCSYIPLTIFTLLPICSPLLLMLWR